MPSYVSTLKYTGPQMDSARSNDSLSGYSAVIMAVH
jgi:hypothetical protein